MSFPHNEEKILIFFFNRQLTLNGSCYREMAQATNFAENKSLEKLSSEPLCTAELTGEVKHELIFLLADLLTFFTGYVFSVVSL